MDVNDIWKKFGFKMPLDGTNYVVNWFDSAGMTEITFIYDNRSDLLNDENYKSKHPAIQNLDIRNVYAHDSYKGWNMVQVNVENKYLNGFYDFLQVIDEAYDIMYEEDYRELKTLFRCYCKEGEEYVKNNPNRRSREVY